MLRVARDETARSASRSALVLAPHPDDETLGCGATILRKVAAGTPVTVVVLTDGRHSHRSAHLTPDELAQLRRGEMAEAATRLGLADGAVRWGGFVDGTLAAHDDALLRFVRGLVDELAPDEIYATSADESHPDHAAVGRAARRAVAGGPARLLEYPVWLWGSWPLRRGDRMASTTAAAMRLLRRRLTKVRSDGYAERKLHALWPGLPAFLLATVQEPAELFLPWHHRSAVL